MQSRLFTGLEPQEQERFLALCTKEHVPKGTLIKKEGERVKKAFFLIEGEMAVKKNSSQGEMEVATIKGGEDVVFSFTCMIDGGKSLTTIVAKTECSLLSFDKKVWLKFCEQNPKSALVLMQNALELMASFLRKSDEKLIQMYQTLEEVL